jgi:hypothetical protein
MGFSFYKLSKLKYSLYLSENGILSLVKRKASTLLFTLFVHIRDELSSFAGGGGAGTTVRFST